MDKLCGDGLWLRCAAGLHRTFEFAFFPGDFQLFIPGFVDFFLSASHPVHRGDISDSRMEPDVIVVMDELPSDAFGILQGQRRFRTDRLLFEGPVEALQFSVGLRIMGRTEHVGGLPDTDELFEVLGRELRSVVADDSGPGFGVSFPCPLQDDLRVGLFHLLADVPGDNGPRAAVEHGAEVVEGSSDVHIGKVHMPMFMGLKRLHEAFAFFRGGRVAPSDQTGGLEHTVGCRWTDCGNVLVEHHERQPPIAFQRVLFGIFHDGGPLLRIDPMVTGNQGVVFVRLAVAVFPLVEFPGGESEPTQHQDQCQPGQQPVVLDEVDDLVPQVMRDPVSVQLSPHSFFVRMRSSMISAMTSSFF